MIAEGLGRVLVSARDRGPQRLAISRESVRAALQQQPDNRRMPVCGSQAQGFVIKRVYVRSPVESSATVSACPSCAAPIRAASLANQLSTP